MYLSTSNQVFILLLHLHFRPTFLNLFFPEDKLLTYEHWERLNVCSLWCYSS